MTAGTGKASRGSRKSSRDDQNAARHEVDGRARQDDPAAPTHKRTGEGTAASVRGTFPVRQKRLRAGPGSGGCLGSVTSRERPAGDFDYEQHGTSYATIRRPDPRIAARVHAALGASRTVLNVGAGAGSYEPVDRYVLAVEPSATMRAQRPVGGAPAVDATAENLPFDDNSFDAAMAILTVHQWRDVNRGLREMRRVSSGPVVVLTIDASALQQFWLTDYIPEVVAVERTRFPTLDRVSDALAEGSADVRVDVVPVPKDCTDGFGEAFYARPEAFLRPEIRAASSGLVLTDANAVQRGLDRLANDLASGAWDQAYGHLRSQAERRGAFRLVTAST